MEKGDEAIMSSASISQPSNNHQRTVPNNSNLVSVNKNHTCTLTSTNLPNARRYDSEGPVDNLVESTDPTVNKSLPGKGADKEAIMRHLEDMVVYSSLFFMPAYSTSLCTITASNFFILLYVTQFLDT